ncbi:cytosine-purine permease [Rickenella mellea]|uniref:Cytosine-purine permease n=1 Tax=Rickenella mellea TaxID=50990 RepID=A0A4Y7QCC7_9AGAM|nr:cytosine-purine permease [Rickenella mellea]
MDIQPARDGVKETNQQRGPWADNALEKPPPTCAIESELDPANHTTVKSKGLYALLSLLEIETHGIEPITDERRTDPRLYEFFFVWFSTNINVLAFSTGSVGPAFFGLGLRDSILVILVVDSMSLIIPAYFSVFGPKLGTRSMVQSRFSWGYYGSLIPSILNVISMECYLILNSIIGGQTLASVSEQVSWSAGIIIISLISFLVAFCGYRVVHWYERVAWIPNVVAFLVMLGVNGQYIVHKQGSTTPTVAAILSFASTTAATDTGWCTIVADYGVYHKSDTSSMRIFIFSYLGFFLSSFAAHALGAAFAASSPYVAAWDTGFQHGNDIGGLLGAVLSPAGNFGKMLVILVALTIPSTSAPTMYSFGTSFMNISPGLAKVPRSVYAVVSTAILIPLAIVGARHFYSTFVDLANIIGYWTGSFAGIIAVEHFVYRKNSFSKYNITDWATARHLPMGAAAVLAFAGSIGIMVPCMSQVWYVGPIARAGTGDIGIFVGLLSSGLLYLVFRPMELMVRRDVSAGERDRLGHINP